MTSCRSMALARAHRTRASRVGAGLGGVDEQVEGFEVLLLLRRREVGVVEHVGDHVPVRVGKCGDVAAGQRTFSASSSPR